MILDFWHQKDSNALACFHCKLCSVISLKNSLAFSAPDSFNISKLEISSSIDRKVELTFLKTFVFHAFSFDLRSESLCDKLKGVPCPAVHSFHILEISCLKPGSSHQ